MEIKFSVSDQAYPLMLECEIIEKVNTVKLLGIHIQDDLNETPVWAKLFSRVARDYDSWQLVKKQAWTKPSY